jgi:biotin carboxylase
MSEQKTAWPFDSVLVANRGEIAVRVLRTVQKLGLRGIVVYHAADRGTLAVSMADQAIEIAGATPVAAYLDPQQILAAAKTAVPVRSIRVMDFCPRTPALRALWKPRAWYSSAPSPSRSN